MESTGSVTGTAGAGASIAGGLISATKSVVMRMGGVIGRVFL
jgi:hypothetical protein